MANYYNINRSIETYELRLIDPSDGQLKSIFDIPSVGGGGGAVDAYTKTEVDALLSGNLNVLSLQSRNNIQTASTLKCNTFENVDTNNIVFSHIGVTYMEFIKDTGTVESPNDDATLKVSVALDTNKQITAGEGVNTSTIRNADGAVAPSFNHIGFDYMKYEDVILNPTTHGLKILDAGYPESIEDS